MKTRRSVVILLIFLFGIPFALTSLFLLGQSRQIPNELVTKQQPQVAGTTNMVYAATNGSASGDGSSNNPYDLSTGLSKLNPGETLILKDGVYQVDNTNLVWFGVQNSQQLTTIKADTNARPIIVRQNGDTPIVSLWDHTRVEGIWFGGNTNASQQQSITLGNYSEVVNNTFFNFYGAINEGGQTHNVISGNRFINVGAENRYHAIYINNFNAQQGEGALIEKNIFIGYNGGAAGGGYATHLWHEPKYVTIRNNFYGDVYYGIVADGVNNTVEDEIFGVTKDLYHYFLCIIHHLPMLILTVIF